MRRRGARATRATASFARVVARGARRAARGGVRKWSVDSRSREARDGGGGGEEERRALARGDGGAQRCRHRHGALRRTVHGDQLLARPVHVVAAH